MLKIRLRRMGATNKAFYRLVVSDSRKATSSAALEEVGTYDPRQNRCVGPMRVSPRAARLHAMTTLHDVSPSASPCPDRDFSSALPSGR